MRPLLFTALLLCVPATLAEPKRPKPKGKEADLSREEQAVVDLTNAQRKEAGLPALKPNRLLTQAARGHSENMARQEKMEHTLDGKTPFDRIKATGYRPARGGENIAWGSRTPEATVKMWMNSPGHKANILNEDYTEIGAGVATSEKGDRYWTQVFGTPR